MQSVSRFKKTLALAGGRKKTCGVELKGTPPLNINYTTKIQNNFKQKKISTKLFKKIIFNKNPYLMKSLLYMIMATTLFACNNSATTEGESTRSKDAPPLYTISDLQKEGLKGKIKTVRYSNYQSVEKAHNEWVPERYNDTKTVSITKHYNPNGFLTVMYTIEKNGINDYQDRSTDSFIYINNILNRELHFVEFSDYDDGHLKEKDLLSQHIYYWLRPYSYKTRSQMCRNNTCDSIRYFMSEYTFDINYREIKLERYSYEDTTKAYDGYLCDYDKDYTNKTYKTLNGNAYTTETILQRDSNGNPTKMLYNKHDGDKYTYDVTYEHYQ